MSAAEQTMEPVAWRYRRLPQGEWRVSNIDPSADLVNGWEIVPLYPSPLAAPATQGAEMVRVPKEASDAIVDSVRSLLAVIYTDPCHAEVARGHVENCGDSTAHWPHWARTGNAYMEGKG